MTRWYQHRFHTVQALELMFWGMDYFPRFLHPLMAMGVALFYFLILKRERRAVSNNLRTITHSRGPALAWKVYRVFYSFSDSMVSYCYVPQATHEQLTQMLTTPNPGAAIIDEVLAAGNGLIVWTAHLGNSEFASRLLELHGRPVNVARVVEDSPAEKMLRERMANDRLRVIDLRRGAAATIELLQALRRNEIVAIQGDRVYNPRHSVEFSFFNKPASFPLGPFLLSEVSGSPVLPGLAIRSGWARYNMVGTNLIYPGATGDLEADQAAALERAVRFLEAQLTVHYHQWMNFFDFWKADNHE